MGPPNSSRVVLVSGASAAGKTSTAMALVERARVPTVFWPSEAVRVGGATGTRDDLVALERQLFHAYVQGLSGYAQQGLVAIGETILTTEADYQTAREARVLLVRLVCPLEVLEERERTRAITDPGTAADTFARELQSAAYDLTVDTSHQSPGDVAATIEFALAHVP